MSFENVIEPCHEKGSIPRLRTPSCNRFSVSQMQETNLTQNPSNEKLSSALAGKRLFFFRFERRGTLEEESVQ
jgi:hypothetical protein